MAFQRVKKMLGISAVVICCGTVMFTFTGCENKQPVAETVQMQEVQDDLAEKDGGAIANDIDLTQSEVDAQTETDIYVQYMQCGTEPDTLTMVNNEQVNYKVKGYVAPNYFDFMKNIDYSYEYNEEEGYVTDGETIVSDNVEETEDGKLLVRDYHMQLSIPVVKYVRTSPDEVEARYIGTAPYDSNVISGITFVLEKNEEGVYKMTDLLGVFDESIKDLPVYEGTFDGWASEVNGPVVYEVGDEIMISGDLALYPHFNDNAASKVANEDGTVPEGQIEEIEIDGVKHTVLRVIRVNGTKKDKDGNLVATKKYALAGLDSKKDTVKGVDKDKVEKQQTEEKDPAAKTEPKKPANGSDTKPGNPAPAKDPASSQAQDTFDRSVDKENDTTSASTIAAEDGVATGGLAGLDDMCYSDLSFE